MSYSHIGSSPNFNYQFPLYPLLLWLGYCAFGVQLWWGVLLNIILHASAVIVFYRLALRVMDRLPSPLREKAALAASAAVLLYPPLVFYEIGAIHPFSLDLLLSFLVLHTCLGLAEDPKPGRFALAGGLISLALIERPTIVFAALPGILGFLSSLKVTRHHMKHAAAALALSAVLPGLWMARNFARYGELSYVSSTGQNLWIGAQKATNGTATAGPLRSYRELLSPAQTEALRASPPLVQSRLFRSWYEAETQADPGLFIHMYLVKLRTFWLVGSNIGNEHSAALRRLIPLYSVFYLSILALALAGGLTAAPHLRLLAYPAALSLFQAYYYVETRHRAVVEPVYILIAAAFLCGAWSKRNAPASRAS